MEVLFVAFMVFYGVHVVRSHEAAAKSNELFTLLFIFVFYNLCLLSDWKWPSIVENCYEWLERMK